MVRKHIEHHRTPRVRINYSANQLKSQSSRKHIRVCVYSMASLKLTVRKRIVSAAAESGNLALPLKALFARSAASFCLDFRGSCCTTRVIQNCHSNAELINRKTRNCYHWPSRAIDNISRRSVQYSGTRLIATENITCRFFSPSGNVTNFPRHSVGSNPDSRYYYPPVIIVKSNIFHAIYTIVFFFFFFANPGNRTRLEICLKHSPIRAYCYNTTIIIIRNETARKRDADSH